MARHKTRKDKRTGFDFFPVKPYRKIGNRKIRRMKGEDIGDHGAYKKVEEVQWNAF